MVPVELIDASNSARTTFVVRNVVVGWLLFQMLGFAWRDQHLPDGRRLAMHGVTSLAIAVNLVCKYERESLPLS